MGNGYLINRNRIKSKRKKVHTQAIIKLTRSKLEKQKEIRQVIDKSYYHDM
jgi:hypothetical protein